jgi:hypothetical protein
MGVTTGSTAPEPSSAARPARLAPPLIALLGLVAPLLAIAVPAPLNADESSYLSTILALRSERVTVPGTELLPPSREILWFDPNPRSRSMTTTPVAPTAPPLYAPLALPFLQAAGWPGLVLLQLCAFVACGLLVYAHAARFATRRQTPWLALAAFALGSYSLDYALGAWPHLLAMMLCLAAWIAGSRARDTGSASLALASGVLVGTAAGIRYIVLAYVVVIGGSLLLFSVRRLRTILAYVAGVGGPLIASSILNDARIGVFHPATKNVTYLTPGRPRTGIIEDAVASTIARVVDFTVWPPIRPSLHDIHFWYQYDWQTKVFMMSGGIKKAWLQSAPWLAVVLIALLLVWFRRHPIADPARRELRAAGLPIFGAIALLSAYGFSRVDGAMNQRYLLEVLPLAAIVFALVLDRFPLRPVALAAGALAGIAAAAALVQIALPIPELGSELAPPRTSPAIALRQVLEMKLPLVLAAATALAVFFSHLRGGKLMWGCVGAALGWALAIHVLEELPATQRRRAASAAMLDGVTRLLPAEPPVALFAFAGQVPAVVPLKLDRDIHILHPWADRGRDMPRLAAFLRRQGREVYFFCDGLLPRAREHFLQGIPSEVVSPARPCLLRLHPR